MELLVTNVRATAKSSITILVQWDSDPSPCKQSYIDYVVDYQLKNLDQCSEVMGNHMQLRSSSISTMISNLEHYSMYSIQVTAWRNGVEISSTTATTTATTQQAGKIFYQLNICEHA